MTTEVRLENPTSRLTLAGHMSHAPSTSDEYYQRYNRVNIALPMERMVSTCVEGSKVSTCMRVLFNTVLIRH